MIRRYDNGAYETPGGVLELDESIHAGLTREIHEASGFEAEPAALPGVYKNMKLGVVALFLRCRLSVGEVHLARVVARTIPFMPPEPLLE